MIKKLPLYICYCAVLLLLGSGCQKRQHQQQNEVPFVAKVGEVRITPEEFRRELARRGDDLTDQKRDSVLQNMIRTEELLAKARAEGFDKDPETVARVKKVIASLYEEKLRGAGVGGTNSTSELEEYYQSHLTEFVMAERARAAVISWQVPTKATEEKRKEYRAHAEAVARQAASLPADVVGFGDLARLDSEDQVSRYIGGDLGLRTETELAGRYGPDLAKKIFALKPGALSEVIETPGRLYLFRGIEHKERQTKTLAEVKDLVSYQVTRAKLAQLDRSIDDKINAGMNVEINREMLEKTAPVTNAPVTPPRAPGA